MAGSDGFCVVRAVMFSQVAMSAWSVGWYRKSPKHAKRAFGSGFGSFFVALEQAEIDRCLFGPIGNRAISTKNNIVHFSEIVSSSLRVRSNNVFCSRRSDRKNG
jgi:hypothetical protein